MKKWRLIAGKWNTAERMDCGVYVNWKRASWIIESDTKPVFDLVSVPGGDGKVDSICIEDMPYDYDIEMMEDPQDDDVDMENTFVDNTYIWNFRVEETA